MSVFISYSHVDSDFVDRLATELISHRKHVWVDRYELRAGDSLISRIQDAIATAGVMLVILSRTSVESEWCKKELSTGLIRELEEKRVLVVPLLIDDCSIPLFLRDKYYADFRVNFEKGLRDVLEAIAGITSDSQGRVHTADYYTDWAIDWWNEDGHVVIRVSAIGHHKAAPFSVLTTIRICCNDVATERYRRFSREGFDWFGRGVIFEVLSDFGKKHELFFTLEDQFEREAKFSINEKSGGQYDVIVSSRRIGDETGKDVLVNIGGQLQTLRDALVAMRGKMSAEETERVFGILAQNVG